MATRRLSIIGSLNPDSSGNVWWEPSSIALANDRYPGLLLRYKDTATKIKASGSFTVPKDYANSPKLIIIWAINVTTGNVVWNAETKPIASGESMDPSTDDDAVNVTSAVPGTALLQAVSSMTLSAAYVADDHVQFSIDRDGTSGSDTAVADALVWDVLFEYSDS